MGKGGKTHNTNGAVRSNQKSKLGKHKREAVKEVELSKSDNKYMLLVGVIGKFVYFFYSKI